MVRLEAQVASRSLFDSALSVIDALCRFGLAAVWLTSGTIKMMDPMGFRQSVMAYQLFPPAVEGFIAQTLPPVEFALGLLLAVGLFLRLNAAVTGLFMVCFLLGIGSAWVRGLQINCGCFSPDVSAEPTSPFLAIVRDLLFLGMAVWLWRRPFTRWALHP
ncbi:MauE/DoxX family redox-associated membrane protein [Corynebacterium epidermidicanis]|uniref:Methylamine utilization protein MauE n=1 Tax=Corynebacterium epidermidicanis TaxID=1050174 RepID=A0A0G3GWH9_9CORY|nr:MauE/DoxX family redox-associated membrane protein [Corynebacterium epidermidicanis]AKK03883.1 Methylamine utilization protein MauE [Corynebacterium epidermidicanis]